MEGETEEREATSIANCDVLRPRIPAHGHLGLWAPGPLIPLPALLLWLLGPWAPGKEKGMGTGMRKDSNGRERDSTEALQRYG